MFGWNNIYFSDKRGWCVFATCIFTVHYMIFRWSCKSVYSPQVLHYISIVNSFICVTSSQSSGAINLCKSMGHLSYHYTFMRPPYLTTLHIEQYTSFTKPYSMHHWTIHQWSLDRKAPPTGKIVLHWIYPFQTILSNFGFGWQKRPPTPWKFFLYWIYPFQTILSNFRFGWQKIPPLFCLFMRDLSHITHVEYPWSP